MKTIDQVVEREAQWLNPMAQADVEAALRQGELDSGGHFRSPQELAGTITVAPLLSPVSLHYPGYSITVGKKAQQTFSIPKERARLDEMLRKGEISHEEHYAAQELLPHVGIAKYWLDTHENLRDDTIADKADNLLSRIQQKVPTTFRQLAGSIRYALEKAANTYRRPDNILAMFPRGLGELTTIAFYYWKQNGEQGFGVFTEGMRNSRNVVHELNLYREPELLIVHDADHELVHRKHRPPRNATPMELQEYEQEIRERVYMMYMRKADEGGSQSDKYKKLAMIAHAFAYGYPHSGTGFMSNRPIKGLYRGPLNDKDSIKYRAPGSGSAGPEEQIAYRQAIGVPLIVLPEGPQEHVAAQYEAQTKETAQYRGEQKATAEHHAETHQPAQHEAAQHQTGG